MSTKMLPPMCKCQDPEFENFERCQRKLVCIRVLTEVTFWNFKLFNAAESRRILYKSAEFRAISCTEFRIRNRSNKFIQETLD
jgi:hypothetical protein